MKAAALFGTALVCVTVGLPRTMVGAEANPKAAAGTTNTYHLVPSDKVSYYVEEDPKRGVDPSPLTVSSLGTIQFPVSRGYDLLIPVDTRNKTLDAVRTELKEKLEEKYYKQATIHLTLLTQTQHKGLVYFRGGIINGTLELFPGDEKTVTQAILEKGPSDFANLKKVKVTRIDPVTKKTTVYDINVKSLLDKPDPAKDLILQDKDVIQVPEKGISL